LVKVCHSLKLVPLITDDLKQCLSLVDITLVSLNVEWLIAFGNYLGEDGLVSVSEVATPLLFFAFLIPEERIHAGVTQEP